MGERRHTVTPQALANYEQQFKALHKDWHYLYKLVEAYMRPHAEREVLEVDLLRIKGRISCDYPVLAEWRSGGYGAPAGISPLFSESTTLKPLTERMRKGGGRAWRAVAGLQLRAVPAAAGVQPARVRLVRPGPGRRAAGGTGASAAGLSSLARRRPHPSNLTQLLESPCARCPCSPPCCSPAPPRCCTPPSRVNWTGWS